MKAYTDIEQSKKLAEILPLESADMNYATWAIFEGEFAVSPNQGETIENLQKDYGNQIIPCWSLSVLFSVLPDEITHGGSVYRNMFFHLKGEYIIQYPRLTTLWPSLLSVEADNPVDACYEMILKLKEKNLL